MSLKRYFDRALTLRALRALRALRDTLIEPQESLSSVPAACVAYALEYKAGEVLSDLAPLQLRILASAYC